MSVMKMFQTSIVTIFVILILLYESNASENDQYLISDDRVCPSNTQCVSLNNCPLVRQLMDRTCLATDRLRGLTCGYRGTEPRVCCPRGGEYGIMTNGNNAAYNRPQYQQQNGQNPSLFPSDRYYNEACYPYEGSDPTWSNTPNSENGITSRPDYSTASGVIKNMNVNCGRSVVRDTNNNKLGVQPWVVRVGFVNVNTRQTNYACLGSIISSNVILTSAYCAKGSDSDNFLSSVRVGEYDSQTNPDCNNAFCANSVQDIAIDRAIIHPQYDDNTYQNNVALLILNQTIEFNLAAQPICILQSSKVPLVGRTGLLVGWGKTTNKNGQELHPTHQQILDLPIVPLNKCIQMYQQKKPINIENLCVGGESKRDACTGFTGGPLVLLEHHSYSRFYLVGIVSFGSDKCGKDGFPSVYTSIHHYADWIRNNME